MENLLPIKNFVYNDIILYSKGWYEKSEDILDDLGYLFNKIYGHVDKSEIGISHLMLVVLDRLYIDLNLPNDNVGAKWYKSHALFEEELNNKMRFYNISREKAIIYLVMSVLSDLSNKEIELNPPIYGKKEHFRLGSMFGKKYPISKTYKEMNKIAQKVFKEQ